MFKGWGYRWSLVFKVIPIIAVIVAVKAILLYLYFEPLELSGLFSGLITADVFLLGFLLADVLADYKEGEKIPGELSAALEILFEEATLIYNAKQAPIAREAQQYVLDLSVAIHDWLYRRIATKVMMDKLSGLSLFVPQFEPLAPIAYVLRFRDAQHGIRRMLIRIRSIREESFIAAGHLVGIAVTLFTVAGMLVTQIGQFYQSLFIIGFISFFLVYLLAIILVLDNPFDYREGSAMEEISLKPLEYIQFRMREQLGKSVERVK